MNVCSVVGVGVIVIWLYWRVFIYIGLPVSTRGGESAINISIPGALAWLLPPLVPTLATVTCEDMSTQSVHTAHTCDQNLAFLMY